jgi:hypothetical protein
VCILARFKFVNVHRVSCVCSDTLSDTSDEPLIEREWQKYIGDDALVHAEGGGVEYHVSTKHNTANTRSQCGRKVERIDHNLFRMVNYTYSMYQNIAIEIDSPSKRSVEPSLVLYFNFCCCQDKAIKILQPKVKLHEDWEWWQPFRRGASID